jgi:hypothetical protein
MYKPYGVLPSVVFSEVQFQYPCTMMTTYCPLLDTRHIKIAYEKGRRAKARDFSNAKVLFDEMRTAARLGKSQ